MSSAHADYDYLYKCLNKNLTLRVLSPTQFKQSNEKISHVSLGLNRNANTLSGLCSCSCQVQTEV